MQVVDDDDYFRSLIWEHLPEARPMLGKLERDELKFATDLGLPDHGRVTAYALASILLVESVLDPALEAPLADADLLSRVAIVLERTIGSGSEYLTDMVSLRVSDHLLAEPEKWEAFRRFAGPGLAKDIEDRSQYFG